MLPTIRININRLLLSIAATVLTGQALANNCDIDRPVKVFVGYHAGGGTDSYARILAAVIPQFLNGQPMVVINKPGGAQVSAMKLVKFSKPDGYHLQAIAMGGALMATMLRDRGIKWFDDFEPIAQFGLTNQAIIVQQKNPIRTAEDLIAAIRERYSNGKKTHWSHPGRGSVSHIGVTAFLELNGVLAMTQDIPYKGGTQSRNALMSGHVNFSVAGAHSVPPFDDLVHAVGLLSDERDPIVNNIPTMKEQGVEFIQTLSPIVIAAPKGTPEKMLKCLADAIKETTEHKSFKELARKTEQSVVYRNTKDTKLYLQHLASLWEPTISYVRTRLEK